MATSVLELPNWTLVAGMTVPAGETRLALVLAVKWEPEIVTVIGPELAPTLGLTPTISKPR